jgi:hypothetical protein
MSQMGGELEIANNDNCYNTAPNKPHHEISNSVTHFSKDKNNNLRIELPKKKQKLIKKENNGVTAILKFPY